MTDDDTLTPSQRRALPFVVASPTLTGAVATCGVSEATLHRWVRLPAFRDAVDAGRRDLARQALAALAAAQGQAVAVLVDCLGHEQVQHRLRAAVSLLELAARNSDVLALDTRLRDLEADRA